MSMNRIATRIAAAALAGALTVGGLMGVGAVAMDEHQVDTSAEETAAKLSVSVSYEGKSGGFNAQGATWS